jgi:1-deoxy-D-xylulose-5-phosphate synthase
MLRWAVKQNYPIAIRYPRGGDNSEIELQAVESFIQGKWEVVYSSQYSPKARKKVAIIAAGKMVQQAILVKDKLNSSLVDLTIINACFIKPIDKELIKRLINEGYSLVTLEDNVILGGLGSAVLQYSASLGTGSQVINLGFKDEFITHGSIDILYKLYGLDVGGITNSVMKLL